MLILNHEFYGMWWIAGHWPLPQNCGLRSSWGRQECCILVLSLVLTNLSREFVGEIPLKYYTFLSYVVYCFIGEVVQIVWNTAFGLFLSFCFSLSNCMQVYNYL